MANFPIYGVLSNNCHIDISTSLHGCKCFATLNNYDKITVRYCNSYNVLVVAEKVNNKWVNMLPPPPKNYLQNQVL